MNVENKLATTKFVVKNRARRVLYWPCSAFHSLDEVVAIVRAGCDVMPFCSELGPPCYAITLPDGSEFSARWQQVSVMKQLVESAWAMSD